jgi:transcriptional regulator with XRE-family HTH domain
MSIDICQKISVDVYFFAEKLPTVGRANSMQTGKLIGERVRQKRKALGMTQEQLEEASGVPQGSISRIESGTAEDVYASTVIGFAKALQVSADYLLGLDEAEQTASNGSSVGGERKQVRRKGRGVKT